MRRIAIALALAAGFALLSAFSCGGSSGSQYSMGPYLQWVTTTEVTVSWRTAVQGTSVVDYGPTPAYGQTDTAPGVSNQHHVRLEGLSPGAAYYYRARSYNAAGQLVFDKLGGPFTTAPAAASTFKFVAMGEPHNKPTLALWNTVLADPALRFLVDASDTVDNGGKLSDWKQFFGFTASYLHRLPWMGAMGNHSYEEDPTGATYLEVTDSPGDGRWWSLRYAQVLFLMLNSTYGDEPEVSTTQLDWIEATLADATDGIDDPTFIVAAFHFPAFTSGRQSTVPKCQWVQANFLPLFEAYDVDLVINGHDGLYERSVKNGVPYIQVTSGILYPFLEVTNAYKVKLVPLTLTVLIVEATPTALNFQAKAFNGATVDSGTILP